MKGYHYIFLSIVSLLLLIITPITLWADWTSKGSTYAYTSSGTFTPISIYKITFAGEPAVGVPYSGTAEQILSPCIDVLVTETFTGVSALASTTATVYERRYTSIGSVNGFLGDGTIIGSNVEYYVEDIQDVSYYNLTNTTFGRSDWEITVSGVTYTGTAFYYYKPNEFSGGQVEGDIHGEFHFTGIDSSGHPLAQVIITSINGTSQSGSYDIVWDHPADYNLEIYENNGGTHYNVNIDRTISTLTNSSSGGNCNLTTTTADGSGISFYLKDFNAGLSLGAWSSSPYSGKSAVYNYSNTSNTNDIAPRVIGLSRASAEKLIIFHGFIVGNVTSETSTTIPSGRIISQVPTAGALTNLGAPIDLVVSSGPPTTTAYTLTASVTGGHGTVSPTSGTYNQGTLVTLTATPDSGYTVTSWSGTDDDTSTSTKNKVTMNANRTVSVEFGSTSSGSTQNNNTGTSHGSGCFTTTSAPNHPSVSGILLIILLGIAYVGLSRLRKKHIDR